MVKMTWERGGVRARWEEEEGGSHACGEGCHLFVDLVRTFLWRTWAGAPQKVRILWRTWARAPQKVRILWRTWAGAPQNLARSASGQSLRVGPANILWRTWAGAPQKPLFLWRTLLGAPQKYVFLWRMGKSCATERQKILWRTLLHAPQKYFCGAPLNGAPQNVNLPISLSGVVHH